MIDHRHNYGIIIDTETANDLIDNLPYDFGFAVIDTKGNVYETFSFVNADIFIGEKELMKSAYFAEKIPQYWEDIQQGKRVLTSTYNIRKTLLDTIAKYDCQFICAHNASFDKRACNNIQRWTTKSKYRWFLPYHLEWWDTMKMARDVILPMPSYQKFCEENGFMTNHSTPRPRLTAEVLYKFIIKDVGFVEEHTALEDVLIEAEILKYCMRQHKKMRKGLYEKWTN